MPFGDDWPCARRADEADLHLQCRSEAAFVEECEGGRPHSVVEHGRQKAALDNALRVVECLPRLVADAHVAGPNLQRLPAEYCGSRRHRDLSIAVVAPAVD